MRDTIFFSADTCHIVLHLPKLIELPAPNCRKLFELMFSEPWNNEEAIQIIELHLQDAIAISNKELQAASNAYDQGWREVQNPKSRRREVVETLKENRRLTEALKTAKTRHDSWVKLNEIYHQVKSM